MGFSQQCVVWLETLGIHEYVREPLVDSVDWATKGAMTEVKKPETVWFVLGIFNSAREHLHVLHYEDD